MFELLSDYFNLMCVLHGQEDKQSYQAFCSRHSGANPLSDPTETLYKRRAAYPRVLTALMALACPRSQGTASARTASRALIPQ